jgi:hypothetical protein
VGIGRREFLKLFGGTLAALTANPSSAIAIFDDQYINRKLGIAFHKPHGWSFADVKEMGEVRAGQILDLEDFELARELVETAQLPILTVSKDKLSSRADRFTPGVTIFSDRIEFPDDFPEEFHDECLDDFELVRPAIQIASIDIETCESMLKEFRVMSAITPNQVSECDAAEYHATFVFEHENMQPTAVRMRTLVIYQRPAIYTLRMYDSPWSGPELTFDYASFVESVKMV